MARYGHKVAQAMEMDINSLVLLFSNDETGRPGPAAALGTPEQEGKKIDL